MVSTFLPDSMKYRQLVSKATSDDEVPAPGFVQEELKRLSFEPDVCTTLEDQLIARLEKKSSNVKLKTLRVMKAICESGSPNFKRDMQRRTQAVRDCLHWQGTPHPTMGDMPNQMVREAAQELINAIYDTENLNNRPPPTSSLGLGSSSANPSAPAPTSASRMTTASSATSQAPQAGMPIRPSTKYTGFGSDSTSAGAGQKEDSVNKYFSAVPAPTPQTNASGFGNTGGPNEAGIKGAGAKAASALTAGFSQLKQTVTGVPAKPQNTATPSGPSLYTGADPGPASNAQSSAGQGMGGIPPGVSDGLAGLDLTPAEQAMIAQATAASLQTAPPSAIQAPAPVPVVHEPVRSAAGQYEETIVANLTAPGGVRAAPPKEDLKQIQAQAKSLDLPLLIMLLCSKLETDIWQSRLKSLHVIDALLKAPDPDVAKQMKKLVANRLQLLKELEQAQQSALADLAKKVVKFLEEAIAADPPAPAKQSQPAAPSSDMLDLGVSNTSSLFAGMNIGSGAAQLPATAAPQAPSKETGAGGVPDLLGGMGGPAPAAVSAAGNNPALDLDSLFGASQPSPMQPQPMMGMQQPMQMQQPVAQQQPMVAVQQPMHQQQPMMPMQQPMQMQQPLQQQQPMAGMQQPMQQQLGMQPMNMGMQQGMGMGMGMQQQGMGLSMQQQQHGMGMGMNAMQNQASGQEIEGEKSSFDFINSSSQAQQPKVGMAANQDPFSFANSALGR